MDRGVAKIPIEGRCIAHVNLNLDSNPVSD